MRAPKQSVWHPYEDTKMSKVPSFGAPGRRIFVVVASYMFFVTLYPSKLGLRGVQNFWPNFIRLYKAQRFSSRLIYGRKKDSQNLVQQDPAEKKL